MHSEVLHVALGNSRNIPIWFACLEELPSYCESADLRIGPCILITDSNLAPLYLHQVKKSLIDAGWETITEVIIPPGESSKSADILQTIYDQSLQSGIDRQTPIFALGGGVIGDLAGYAAATLLRGLPLVHVPTSLIAQVDSSIGGKTGINHSIGKNLIGAFYQPDLVLTDLDLLRSLPELEWTSGLAEVVKHGLIADADFFTYLSSNWDAILRRDKEYVRRMVIHAARIKASIVSKDEKETSCRAILNFGHTFAHSIERVAGYGQFTHGEAVALGMRAATKVSSLLHSNLPLHLIDSILQRLPVRNSIRDIQVDELIRAMYFDKKVQAGNLRLILIQEPGHAYVSDHVREDQITQGWEFIM